MAHGRHETREIGGYFVTALVSALVFYGALSTVMVWPLKESLHFALRGADLEAARDLMPYAIISFLMMNFNGAIQGTLVGLQRSDWKSQIVIGSLIVQLLLAIELIPRHGLKGLAEAQILQYFFAIAVGYVIAVRHMQSRYALWPQFRWTTRKFVELWSFGLQVQAISTVSFFYDPVSKFMISSLAGVETLGLFEMAQKTVLQVRQLVVGPATILMPVFAHVNDRTPNEIGPLYRKSLAASIVIGSSLMGAVVLLSPVLSGLWLGHVETLFVILVSILSVAWVINIFGSPVYILAVSTGSLKWNFWGAMLTLICTPLLAYTIGKSFGPVGVVLASTSALALGSLFSMIMNCHHSEMPLWTKMSDVRNFVVNDLARFARDRRKIEGTSFLR